MRVTWQEETQEEAALIVRVQCEAPYQNMMNQTAHMMGFRIRRHSYQSVPECIVTIVIFWSSLFLIFHGMKLPKVAGTVNEVLSELKSLAEEAAETHNPNGLFFALYRLVTLQVKRGIEEKMFDNPERMETVDVVFANLLFDQVRGSRDGDQVSVASWRFFFQAQGRHDLTAAQHMLLGVAPHILHDLALAVFKVVPKEEIESFRQDYVQINDLLFKVLEEIQDILGSKSCGMRFVDWNFCKTDEWIAMTELVLVRDQAFEGARRLHAAAAATNLSVEQVRKELDAESLAFSEALSARVTTCVLCGIGVPEQEKFGSIIGDCLQLALK